MELAPAGIGSRFLALALDTVIQVVLYVAIILLSIWLGPIIQLRWLPTAWVGGIAIFLLFCVYWGYFAAFEIFWNGQTPGKRVAGLRVVKDTGRPITAIEGIGRNLMRTIDGLFFYLVGMVSVMLSSQNKRLGDYVAGTVVIHDKPTSEVKPDWNFSQPTEAAFRPELANVSEQDLIVIETFLHRRVDLEGMVRLNTAIRLCELMQHKTGLTKVEGESDEEYLETLARQVRDRARLRN
jgi:uncharacterized RDD family membrane protein YckC